MMPANRTTRTPVGDGDSERFTLELQGFFWNWANKRLFGAETGWGVRF